MKWPGGKYRLAERIRQSLPAGRRLIEPFAGSAAVFLNTEYAEYLLADLNPDLIFLYQHLSDEGQSFIDYCRRLFHPGNNSEAQYYQLRGKFNDCRDRRRRSALFLYLNRHCYNGLCRYNSRGKFNTPFGRYKKPYFPEREMLAFHRAAANAEFLHANFQDSLLQARQGDVVYCDPPYVPLSETSFFTDYHTGGFHWNDQVSLVRMARELVERGVQVVISNHDTREITRLYRTAEAHIERFSVRRTISCDTGNRTKVGEILAVFGRA